MHRERHAGLVASVDHGHAAVPVRRERLLDDGADPMPVGELGKLPVRVHAGDDVDEAEAALGEHPLRVRIPVRHAERLRGRLRLAGVDVAHSHQLGALRLEVLP